MMEKRLWIQIEQETQDEDAEDRTTQTHSRGIGNEPRRNPQQRTLIKRFLLGSALDLCLQRICGVRRGVLGLDR